MLNEITASLICMDLSDIKSDIDVLLDNGINQLHADFMDNTFVPRLGISPELIQWIKKRYGNNVKIDSHLMVRNPIECIDVIAPYSDWLFIHYESTPDQVRALQILRRKYPGLKIGVAYNLGTTVTSVFQKMDLLDGYMFMGISPGVLGTNSYPCEVREKIIQVRRSVWPGADIFVDGSVSFKTIPDYTSYYNVKVVCGSSTLFKIDDETELMDRDEMIVHNINKIKGLLE